MIAYSDADYVESIDDEVCYWILCAFERQFSYLKKQNVVTRSSAKSEYKVMTQTATNMFWVKSC